MQPVHTSKLSIKDQILGLSRQVGRLSASLRTNTPDLPRNVIDELAQVERLLYKLSRKSASAQEELDNMVALANISQMVNSSLEVDEVLRIAMDTVIRMINAERGFLMLRE